MKIISNFKDYYDFMVGKYGIDDRIIYERVCSTESKDNTWHKSGLYKPDFQLKANKFSVFDIAFCGFLFRGFYYDGKFYYEEEDIDNNIPDEFAAWYKDPVLTNLNDKHKCPTLLVSGRDYHRTDLSCIKNVRLLDFGFGQVIKPEDAFLGISNFLSKRPDPVDNRTNKEKILSNGFDLKSSFRH